MKQLILFLLLSLGSHNLSAAGNGQSYPPEATTGQDDGKGAVEEEPECE